MNNEDKILLMAYVDGELNSSEVLRAEAIINSNQAAMNFTNQLKIANASIQSSYQTIEHNELDARLDSFANKKFKKDKASITQFISSFFFSRQTLNYSFTALFFLSVGIFYADYSNIEADIPYKNSEFDKFTKDTIELDFFKTKSISLNQSVDDILLESIIEIIGKESKLATITHGADIYRLELESKIVNEFGIECYAGKIFKDKKTEFIFCNNNSILSISYK